MDVLDSRARAPIKNSARASGVSGGTERAPRVSAEKPIPAAMKKRLRELLQTIEFETPRTIAELALEFHLSPSYLQRLFKQETGVRLGELLNSLRLERAEGLLTNSYMSVKEIAYVVGYGHASSFIRAFERRFSKPPGQYRLQRNSTKC
jgi:AraC-like DNA-binding protein